MLKLFKKKKNKENKPTLSTQENSSPQLSSRTEQAPAKETLPVQQTILNEDVHIPSHAEDNAAEKHFAKTVFTALFEALLSENNASNRAYTTDKEKLLQHQNALARVYKEYGQLVPDVLSNFFREALLTTLKQHNIFTFTQKSQQDKPHIGLPGTLFYFTYASITDNTGVTLKDRYEVYVRAALSGMKWDVPSAQAFKVLHPVLTSLLDATSRWASEVVVEVIGKTYKHDAHVTQAFWNDDVFYARLKTAFYKTPNIDFILDFVPKEPTLRSVELINAYLQQGYVNYALQLLEKIEWTPEMSRNLYQSSALRTPLLASINGGSADLPTAKKFLNALPDLPDSSLPSTLIAVYGEAIVKDAYLKNRPSEWVTPLMEAKFPALKSHKEQLYNEPHFIACMEVLAYDNKYTALTPYLPATPNKIVYATLASYLETKDFTQALALVQNYHWDRKTTQECCDYSYASTKDNLHHTFDIVRGLQRYFTSKDTSDAMKEAFLECFPKDSPLVIAKGLLLSIREVSIPEAPSNVNSNTPAYTTRTTHAARVNASLPGGYEGRNC